MNYVIPQSKQVSATAADGMAPLEDVSPVSLDSVAPPQETFPTIPTNIPTLLEGDLESVLIRTIVQGADL